MDKIVGSIKVILYRIKMLSDIILISLLYILTISAVIWETYNDYQKDTNNDIATIETKYKNEFDRQNDVISTRYKDTIKDIVDLAGSSIKHKSESAQQALDEDINLVLGQSSYITKVIYIDSSGETQIEKVYNNGEFLPTSEIHSYVSKSFFAKALQLYPGEVYSEITLNQVSQSGVNSFIATLSTPVYETEIPGVLVVEMDLTDVLKDTVLNTNVTYNIDKKPLQQSPNTEKNILYIINSQNITQLLDQTKNENSEQFQNDLHNPTYFNSLASQKLDDKSPLIGYMSSDAFPYIALFFVLLTAGVVPLVKIIHKQRENKTEITKLSNIVRVINKILRHDLTNKFTQLRYQIELFLEDPSSQNEIEKCSPIITDALSLISDMQELESTLQTGIALTKVDLYQVINEIAVNQTNLEIEITGQGIVKADKALKVAFSNIIENAWKHGNASNMKISIEEVLGGVQISFADNGKGMTKKDMENYIRMPMTVTDQSKGLGLYIVRQTIERYGGKIWVESDKNKKTIITLYLPK